ncbi:MAG: ClpX C4-type zinc finger protein [Pirellulaceae bacterium]
MWEPWAILAGWLIIFCLIVAYSERASAKALKGPLCSFCRRWQVEIGDMAEAGTRGIFICYPCASRCKELIERECHKRGRDPVNHEWPEDDLPTSQAPAP